MNLAFGLLSSTEDPAATVQLLDALGPHAQVFVHHDGAKGPAPDLGRFSNAQLVRDPVPTSWGEWSLCEAILRLVREALDEPDWDYFQLLSGSCLPIKPINAFEHFLAGSDADVHMDLVALDEDPVALMSHGYRAYAPADSTRHRVLRRLRSWYLGDQPSSVDRQGLGFALPATDRPMTPGVRIAIGGMRLVNAGSAPGFGHPFDARLRCFVGSTWWGARRAACEYLVGQPEDGPLQRFFKRVRIPDEFYFQTVLGNAGFAMADSNHLISRFDDAHPSRLGLDALPILAASPRFFARKFPNDPAAEVRLEVLGGLATPAARHDRHVPMH